MSKPFSTSLPVYCFDLPSIGLISITRFNFLYLYKNTCIYFLEIYFPMTRQVRRTLNFWRDLIVVTLPFIISGRSVFHITFYTSLFSVNHKTYSSPSLLNEENRTPVVLKVCIKIIVSIAFIIYSKSNRSFQTLKTHL